MKQFYCQEVCLSTLLTEIASLCSLLETFFDNRVKTELYPQRCHRWRTHQIDLYFLL